MKLVSMTIDLFPTTIYKTEYFGDLISIAKNLTSIINLEYNQSFKNNQGSMRGDGVCSYVSKRDLHKNQEFTQIVQFIEHHAQIYHKKLKYSDAYTPKVCEMWFNVYKKESFIDSHNHAPIDMTATFYINKEPGIGNLVFENPLSTILKYSPYPIDRNQYHLLFEEEIDTKAGDLIIFPGWMNHKTRPNLNDTDRIIIGANISCTG
jgi:uncharacterized protein (TIGR02466 family)